MTFCSIRLVHCGVAFRRLFLYQSAQRMDRAQTTRKELSRLALWIEYPILQHGGTEVLVRELIAGLAPHYALTLISDDAPEILEHPLFKGKIQRHFRWQPAGLTAQRSVDFSEQLIAAGIDLVHFHFGENYAFGVRRLNFCPAVHLHRRGVRCLSTNHGVFGLLVGYIGPQRSVATKLALLPAAWLGKMQTLSALETEIAVSDNDCRSLRRRYWPLASRFQRIYHSRIRESEPVTGLPRENFIFCAGTVTGRKGQPYLAKAFLQIAEKIPGWRLVFAGRPGQLEVASELSALVSQMPDRIQWIQDCSDAEMKRLLQTCGIYCMPSLHEGLGLSLQEALYYGCACVASRAGGMQDLIQHNDNGLLAPPANVPGLADALLRLTRDPALRDRLRLRAKPSVLEKDMTSERMVKNYRGLYQRMLGS